MKYLVWGTGQIAFTKLSQKGIEKIADEIIAFVDNNTEKEGTLFFDKKVILPCDINKYSFDKIIILCSYEKEIRNQIIKELGFQDGNILGLKDFDNMVCKILVGDYQIFLKKILIIGSKTRYLQLKDSYNDLFQIVGFVDVFHLEEIVEYEYDYIIMMNLMDIPLLDRNKGRIHLENRIINLLKNEYAVEKLIFTDEVYINLREYERTISWGEENQDKTFLIIRLGGTIGLGACVLEVAKGINYAREKGYIPVVDMMTYSNQYLECDEIGVNNAWEKFFSQPADVGLSDISHSKNIRIISTFSGECENLNFLKEHSIMEKRMELFFEKIGRTEKRILGVLVRGTDYVQRHPYGHCIQPDVVTMIKKVREMMIKWGRFDKIYLCTEVEEVIVSFQKEFGEMVCFYPQRRIQEKYSEYISEHKFERENDGYYRGEDYWCALKVLSQCDALIAGNCGGTAVALKLNNKKYEHTFIFELGRYGIDNIEK